MSDGPQVTVIDPNQHPDSVLRSQFECYGIMWSKNEPMCGECVIRDRCITILTKATIPNLRKEHGNPDISAGEVAELNGSDEESTQILFQITAGKKILDLLPPQMKVGDPPPPAPAPSPIVEPAAPPVAKKAKATPPAKKKVKAEPVKKVANKPLPPPAQLELKAPSAPVAKPTAAASVPEAVVVSGKQPEDAPSPKAKKEAPVKTKKPATPKAPAKAAKPAVAAPTKKAAPKKVTPDDLATRWEKERERTPAVMALKPGATFEREYKGKLHKVTYQKGHVDYLGKKYPSLAAVMTEIVEVKTFKRADGKTRTMTDWSVPRFFQLGAKKPAKKAAKKKAKK